METLWPELLARAAHEMNRLYCIGIGDTSQPTWDEAPDWQKASAKDGVLGALDGNTPQQSHERWLELKKADGWVWGEVKDPEKKKHPCMVDYADLPEEQRRKDDVFIATVRALAVALGVEHKGATRTEASLQLEVRRKLLETAARLLDCGQHAEASMLVDTHTRLR